VKLGVMLSEAPRLISTEGMMKYEDMLSLLRKMLHLQFRKDI
jgi:hypothetical protein